MRRLLFADTSRLFHSKWFWLITGGMLAMSVGFIFMQYTAMDYVVPLSRVIFLPMSFYGVAAAALISLFIGEDFSDGFIRNKIVAGRSRYSIYASSLLISCLACVVMYLSVTFFTTIIGCFFFERNITVNDFCRYLLLGIGMSIAYGCIYCGITMFSGNKTTGAVICMGVAFFLLCTCLHTNQIMVQPEYKDGIPNPAYMDGFAKKIYAILHDLNPSGQAAQLSAMEVFYPPRMIICDLGWVLATTIGAYFFKNRNIN